MPHRVTTPGDVVTAIQEHDRFLRRATPVRRLLQGLVAIVGWVVFVYWWWIVFGRVSRWEVVFTGVFVGVTALVSIFAMSVWALYNKRQHRRLEPRSHVRPSREEYSRDTLLRTISFPAGPDRIKTDPIVEIVVDENRKVYRPPQRTSDRA